MPSASAGPRSAWKLKAWARSACSRASRAIAAETKLSCTQAESPSILLVDLVVHHEPELVGVLEGNLLVGQRAPGVELVGDQHLALQWRR